MKIALIYTGAVLVPSLTAQTKEALPGWDVMNLLDDSLIFDCQKAGGMDANIQRRLCNLYQYAYESGADVILNTCSSVGGSIDVGKEIIPVPLHRIDRPMVEKAVAEGSRIGVIATLATTLDPTCKLVAQCAAEMGKEVTVYPGLAKGAYEANCSGNGELHDQLITQTAKELVDQCDVIILAQASMQRMEKKLQEEAGIAVYASPSICLDFLKHKYMT